VRYLLIILSALLTAIGIGAFLSEDSGLVIFSYADYNIQTSVSFFVLALLLLFMLVYLLVRTLGSLFRLPKNIKHWSKQRRNRRSEKFLGKGILALLSDDWLRAEELFQRGAADSSLPLVNYLAAARAAQHAGAIQRRDHYLRLAHDVSPEASQLVGLCQAKLQLSQKQTEQAYATLKHLGVDSTNQDQVNILLLEAATELNEWEEALGVLNNPQSKKFLTAEQLKEWRLTVYAGLLHEAGVSHDRSKLEEIWTNIPRNLKQEFYLVEQYVNARRCFPDTSDCEILLRKLLRKRWDDSLVRLYGLVEGSNTVKQIQFAEQQLASHANDAILLLSLGRLCKRSNLWGKALDYLKASLSHKASAEAYQELALMLEQQGDHLTAGTYFQKGLALATGMSETGSLLLLDGPEKNVATATSAGKPS
jgi:HemY protein